MPDTSTILRLALQTLGENLNQWGTGASGLNPVVQALEDAVAGAETISLTGNLTLSSVNYATDNQIAPRIQRLTDGGLSAAPTLTIPATQNWWIVDNTTAYAVTYSNGSSTGSVSANRKGLVYTDGTTVWSEDFFESADQTAFGSLNYTFSTTTTDADPGAGFLRLDNATQGSATGIYISDTDGASVDVSAWLLAWDDSTSSPKGYITLRSIGTTSTFRVFAITSLTDNTGYMDFTVSHVAGNGSFANSDSIAVSFTPNGNKGDTGAMGPTGTVSTTGEPTAAGNAVPMGSAWYMAACFGR